jgi:hypothetical protein
MGSAAGSMAVGGAGTAMTGAAGALMTGGAGVVITGGTATGTGVIGAAGGSEYTGGA